MIKYTNHVTLTGTIRKLPNRTIRMKDGVCTRFDLRVYRKEKNGHTEPEFDDIRIIILNDETFHLTYKEGDRIRVSGELQSRNYTVDNYEVDHVYETSVSNYIKLFEQFPCQASPEGKKKQLIDWTFIINAGLIGDVPKDSLFRADGKKNKDSKDKYVYRIDKDKIIYKEKQHVSYEVVLTDYEKEESLFDPRKGDTNTCILLGEIVRKNSFNIRPDKTITNFNIKTKSDIYANERYFYNHAITWEDPSHRLTKDYHVNEYIRIAGRLQSRTYEKELIIRKTSPSGLVRKKKIFKNFNAVEISTTKLRKVPVFLEEEANESGIN